MAREAVVRFILEGQLHAETPIHVGGLGSSVESDMPLARDGQGRLYIPGTSIAGAIRSWGSAPDIDSNKQKEFWGYQSSEPEEGNASHIWVADGYVQGGVILTETRDHVGIDRRTGAAAHAIKFDREVLPVGTRIPLRIVADCPRKLFETGSAIIMAIQAGLEAGLIPFGASKSRGLGRLVLKEARCRKVRLDCPEGILSLVTNPDEAGEPLKPYAIPVPDHIHQFLIGWEPETPVMVKDSRKGNGADMVPLVTGSFVPGRLAFVLPGSSIKGALRSHAERIVRTVLGFQPTQGEFQSSIQVPLVDFLFGTCRLPENPETSASSAHSTGSFSLETPCEEDPKPGLGALSIDDCHSRETVSTRGWESILMAEEQEIQNALVAERLVKGSSPSMRLNHHVAIDRWTGGAADTALFSVLEPWGIEWSDIRIRLDTRRIPKAVQKPALALLHILVRDLATGRIPLGFGTNRGMGSLKVTEVTLPGKGGRVGASSYQVPGDFEAPWQEWIKRELEKVAIGTRK